MVAFYVVYISLNLNYERQRERSKIKLEIHRMSFIFNLYAWSNISGFFFSFSNLPLAQMTIIGEIQRIFKMQHAYRIIIISIGVSITIDYSNYYISMNSIEIHIFISLKTFQ